MRRAAASRGRRLHPATLLFDVGNRLGSLVVWGLAVLIFASRSEESWYLLFLVPPVVEGLVRFVSFRYAFGAQQLIVRQGIFLRRVRHVPFERIQNIDTVQGPLHRLLGVVEVRLETAAGSGPEAVLRVISNERLEELRGIVFADSPGPLGADDAFRGEEPFFRMPGREILLFGLLSQRGLVIAGGAVLALRELVPESEVERHLEDGVALVDRGFGALGAPGWVILGILTLLLLQVASVLWAFLTLHGFRVERIGDDLRTTCGLLTRQTAWLPRSRVQFLEIRRSLLQRLLGRVSVRVLSAGGDSTRKSQISRKWLVPSCPERELEGILDQVQPEAGLAQRSWRAVHPRAARRLFVRWFLLLETLALAAWWLSPTAGAVASVLALVLAILIARGRARALAWSLGTGAMFLRDGLLTRRVACVRFEKIQSIRVSRSPFDRRMRMARLSIDTAGTPGTVAPFSVPFLGLREACRLARTLRAEAGAVGFRW